jgi:hypothetical protein
MSVVDSSGFVHMSDDSDSSVEGSDFSHFLDLIESHSMVRQAAAAGMPTRTCQASF